MKYKEGQILQDDDGSKMKILGIAGKVYFISARDEFGIIGNSFMEQELDDLEYFPALEQPFKPEESEMYYYLWSDGIVGSTSWRDDKGDKFRLSVGNCFREDDKKGQEEYRQKLINLGK